MEGGRERRWVDEESLGVMVLGAELGSDGSLRWTEEARHGFHWGVGELVEG